MFLTNIKYSLSGCYGRLPGYEMQEMNVSSLSRKKQICEEALKVLNKIDRGISPRRGTFILFIVFLLGLCHLCRKVSELFCPTQCFSIQCIRNWYISV